LERLGGDGENPQRVIVPNDDDDDDDGGETGPGAHPASCTMGTGPFPGVKQPGCGVDHAPHLVPSLKEE